MTINLADCNTNMTNTFEAFIREIAKIRTGRASPSMLDAVLVEAYGSKVPITQVASVSIADTRTLSVQAWDSGVVRSIEKAIRESDLGVSPTIDGSIVRVTIPDLTQERRKDLVKIINKYAENTRIAVRNIRRDFIDMVKKHEKSSEISEDQSHKMAEQIQKTTDDFIKKIDHKAQEKAEEIMKI